MSGRRKYQYMNQWRNRQTGGNEPPLHCPGAFWKIVCGIIAFEVATGSVDLAQRAFPQSTPSAPRRVVPIPGQPGNFSN